MITEIELPSFCFSDDKITGLKRKNFIWGRNGTGKSSISKSIVKQYGSMYDVHLFQGIESILTEDRKINSIVLGRENTKLQPQIDDIKKKINDLEKKLNPNSPNTIGEKYYKAKENVEALEEEADLLYQGAAKALKDAHVTITGASYNKRKFSDDIKYAAKLKDEELIEAKRTVELNIAAAPLKEDYSCLIFDFNHLRIISEELMTRSVARSSVIKFTSQEERQWVESGVRIHKFEEETRCKFCGNIINLEQIEKLSNLINDEVRRINNDLEKQIREIEDLLERYRNFSFKSSSDAFDPSLQSSAKVCYQYIEQYKEKAISFLQSILIQLKKKQSNIYCTPSKDKLEEIPSGLSELVEQYKKLYSDNQKLADSLEKRKQEALNKIRLHLVRLKCDEKSVDDLLDRIKSAKVTREELKVDWDKIKALLAEAQLELEVLKNQTIDESIAANYINAALTTLGAQSFMLKRSEDSDKNGVYTIVDLEGNIRDLETLSTGELNIVAFLWFINSIKSNRDKEQIIIFDDPMNSNDDFVQYLIISILQNILKTAGNENRQVFILTHNLHFYLNTRYQWWKDSKNPDKYDRLTIHLRKEDRKATAQYITSQSDDIKHGYEGLCKEVCWLYQHNKANYMLNPIRCIIETYKDFNQLNDIYDGHAELQKLLNVNSHGIDDIHVSANGKTAQEIMSMVKSLFKDAGGLDHFNKYFGELMSEYN